MRITLAARRNCSLSCVHHSQEGRDFLLSCAMKSAVSIL
jgi:hypothetical protein